MQTLAVLLVAVVAACALPGHPGPSPPSPFLVPVQNAPQREGGMPIVPPREFIGHYTVPQYLFPHFVGYDDSPKVPAQQSSMDANDWLTKEIERINQMKDLPIHPYEKRFNSLDRNPFIQRILEEPIQGIKSNPKMNDEYHSSRLKDVENNNNEDKRNQEKSIYERKAFAVTPLEKGYYGKPGEPHSRILTKNITRFKSEPHSPEAAMLINPPRQVRQNPNLSRTKTLIADNLDKLRAGLITEGRDVTTSAYNSDVVETAVLSSDSIYGVALVAAVAAALTIAIFGFAFGWYTLSKKAKAAADVDYPAYGVTGPNLDTSGDRKLAQSAHMYHYQHQKQQILAMERNGLDQRTGSMSEPESEDENEEGDYTVYECPGFASTGDMEVKNPLFSDDPTPATPGKCEIVKQQPKE